MTGSPGTGHLVPLAPGWSVWRRAALRGAGMPFEWLAGFSDPADCDADGQSRTLRRLLTEPRFVEALAWQNPAAVASWIAKHVAALRDDGELRRSGYRQAVLARYAQRYCTKNDSIGFFGPVAWAEFDPPRSGLDPRGSAGLRSRSVHFETWALEALVDAWFGQPDLTPHLPFRLHPAVSFDGERLRRPWRPVQPVDSVTAALLTALAEGVGAEEVVTAAAVRAAVPVEAARQRLLELREAEVVVNGLVVPMDEQPEAHLRAQVGRLADRPTREALLAQLDELDELRELVVKAAGDPLPVHEALTRLTGRVAEITGREAGRAKAESPRGRTPVYEDCRRDLDVTIGGDLTDALRAPLALLLRSASWLSVETAEAVGAELRERYDAQFAGRGDTRLSEFYFASADVLSGAPGTAVHAVVEDFRLRWAELLADGVMDDAGTELRLSSKDIAPLAAALFPARPPAWTGARYHSPDLMLARSGAGGQWVLGELHVALNTLESRLFHTQAEHRDELADAVAADMAAGRVVALLPGDSPEVSPRTYPPLAVHVPDRYVYWSLGKNAGVPGASGSTPAIDLLVVPDGDGLAVEAAGGSWRAPLAEVFGEFLTALVVNRFKLRSPAPHLPRVRLDDVVIDRRTWRFPVAGLPCEAERIGEVVATLRAAGVPRHAFVMTDAEYKPFYIDLAAPLVLRNLSRAIRAARERSADAWIVVSEMSPGPDELWLTGGEGERYTTEFRVVAVDERQPRHAGIRSEADRHAR